MKKFLTTILTTLIAGSAFAAFPTNENTYAVDSSKVTGNFSSFQLKWVGANTQQATFGFTDGTTAINLDPYNVAIKVSKKSATGVTAYISDASSGLTQTNITISTSNVIWTINRTNIPPNNRYQVEIWTFDGATTNPTRTLAQGKLTTLDSLYDDNDDSYPWPTTASLADYLPLSGGTMTGALILTGAPSATAEAATKGYVDTAVAGETNVITSIVEGTATDITTNGLARTVNVDGTESFNASGATNLNGTSIASGTVADGRIASTIARDSELTQVLAGTGIGVVTSGVNRTVSADLTQAVNGSGVTNLNGSNIASGTVADARIASTIMRDSEGLLLTGGTMSGNINMGAGSFTNVAIIGLGAGDVTSFRSVAGNEIARITETFLRATKGMTVFEDFTVLQDSTLTGTLSVTGAVDTASTLIVGSAGATTLTTSNSTAAATSHLIGKADDAGLVYQISEKADDSGHFNLYDGAGNLDIQLSASGGNYNYINNGLGFGIGTTSPDTALEVVGDIRATQNATNNCTLQYWAASNRWALVQIINSQTNVTFTSP